MQGNPIYEGEFAAQTGGRSTAEMMAKPEEHTHMGPQFHQAHLFGRPADVSVTGTQVEHGQWGYTDYTKGREQDLGTIRVGRGAPTEPQMQQGYHPGDTEAVAALTQGRGYSLETNQRKRVTKTWNERNPTHKVREY